MANNDTTDLPAEENGNGHGEFTPPYKAEQIVGDSLKHRINKKPLLNAENMLLRGKYRSALEIYSRTLTRFSDPERQKILTNIRDLQNFIKEKEPSFEHGRKLVLEPEKDFSSALKELTDDLTNSLREGLNQLEQIHSELPEEAVSEEKKAEEPKVNPIPIFIPTSTLEVGKGEIPPLGMDYPALNREGQQEGNPPVHGSLKREDLFGVYVPPNFIAVPPQKDEKASSQKLDIVLKSDEGDNITPEDKLKKDYENKEFQEKINLGLPEGLPSGEWFQRPPSENIGSVPPEGFIPPTYRSAIDIMADLYHSPDWSPYRNLPVSDRRTGEERRRVKKPVKTDRRTGTERRKVDLFKQREEFLKNWSTKVQAEQARREYLHSLGGVGSSAEFSPSDFGILGQTDGGGFLNGDIKTSPGDIELIEIGLPDPIEKKVQEDQPFDQNQITESVPSPPPLQEIGREPTKYNVANEEFIRDLSREINLVKIDLPDPLTMRYDGFEDAPKRNISWEPMPEGGFKEGEGGEVPHLTTEKVLFPTVRDETIHTLFKIDLPDPKDTTTGNNDDIFGTPGQLPSQVTDSPPPDIEIVESDTPPSEETQEMEIPPIDSPEREAEPERMIHGILELKPPEVDDAPFLTLTYDFGKIPHSFRLSKNYSIMEYSYYKYKPMLMKAQEFARRKMLKNALNYYRVIKSQNIPPELKKMINRNILDITEFLEKYLMSKGGG